MGRKRERWEAGVGEIEKREGERGKGKGGVVAEEERGEFSWKPELLLVLDVS